MLWHLKSQGDFWKMGPEISNYDISSVNYEACFHEQTMHKKC